MNRVKVNKSKDYTVISNVFLRDKNLSLKAKGMLSVIMSLSDNWDFSINGLDKIILEGKRAIYSTIDELIEHKYCERKQLRSESGFGEMEYTFYENPNQNVHTHNVDTQVEYSQNAPQYSIDIPSTKNKEVNNKKEAFDFSLMPIGYVDLVKEYIQYRKQIKKPYKTQGAVNALGAKLVLLSNNNLELAKKIAQQSYDKEWLDVFTLKEEQTIPTTTKQTLSIADQQAVMYGR